MWQNVDIIKIKIKIKTKMRQERQQQWIGGPELGGQVQSPGSNLESSSREGINSLS